MRSGHLVPALRAELGPGFDFRPAARAFVLWTKWLAAFGAKFRSLCSCAARRTQRGGLASQIEVFSQILGAHFFFHLLDGGLRLFRGEFDFQIRSAVEAQRAFLVPAGTDADPVGAFRALTEVRLRFFDGRSEGVVVRGALDGAFDFIGGVARLAKKTAKQASGGSQGATRHSGH